MIRLVIAALLYSASFLFASESEDLHDKAKQFYQHGQDLKALETAQQAVEKASNDSERATALYLIGSIEMSMRKYPDAMTHFNSATDFWEKKFGPESELVSRGLSKLRKARMAAKQYEGTEELLQRALKIANKHSLNGEMDLIEYKEQLGELYRLQGRLPEAKTIYEQAIKVRETQGTGGNSLRVSLLGLADVFMQQGEVNKSVELYERVLTITENSQGKDHIQVYIPLAKLGVLYTFQGKYEKAESTLNRALETAKLNMGPESGSVAVCLDNLAAVYQKTNRAKDAEVCLRSAKAIRDAIAKNNPPGAP